MPEQTQGPLLLVGTGRCGSTIVYSCLAMHPDFSWISSWLTTAPRWPLLALGNRIWKIPGTDRWREERFFPKPVEPNVVWEAWVPEFMREDADPGLIVESRELRRLVSRVCRYQGNPRYLGKLVGRPVKVSLLAALFPDATFVHVTRGLAATVSSLLLVDFFRDNAPLHEWPWGIIPEPLLEFYEQSGRAEEVAAAITVYLNRTELDGQLAALDPARVLEVSYEGFINDPIDAIRRIGHTAAIAVDDGFEARIRRREIRGGLDVKWKRHLTAAQAERLESFQALTDSPTSATAAVPLRP